MKENTNASSRLYYHTKQEFRSYFASLQYKPAYPALVDTATGKKRQTFTTSPTDPIVDVSEITKIRPVPRITFCGLIIPQPHDNAEIHIGVAMQGHKDNFSKKIGRSISSKRASSCPLVIVNCKIDEIIPVFHEAVKHMIPEILDLRITRKQKAERLYLSMNDILEEKSAD